MSTTPETPSPPTVKRRRRRRWTWWQRLFFVIITLIVLGAGATVGILLGIVRTLPPLDRLEYYDPPEITTIYDRDGEQVIGKFDKEKRLVIGIDEIPARLQMAFLAIEDSRFYDHFGVDLIGVVRAMRANFLAGRFKEGASTITQQLARNILPEVGREKKLERKIKEALMALKIERHYAKPQILEFYLNHIFLGYSSYGVQAAAMTYFSKRLDELTLSECALLAGIPKGPSIYNPIRNPKRAKARRDSILHRMRDLRWIEQDDYEAALAEDIQINRGGRFNDLYPYFRDALHRELQSYYGLSQEQLETGGYRIVSTIDPAIQDACTQALRTGLIRAERMWQERKPARRREALKDWDGRLRAGRSYLAKIESVGTDSIDVTLEGLRGTLPLPEVMPYWEPANILEAGEWLDVKVASTDRNAGRFEGAIADEAPIQGAIIVLDVHRGEVLGLVGGGTPFYDKHFGYYNRAIMGGRQVGSSIKPFFYAAGLQSGMQPNSIIIDEPIRYGDYEPRNYEKKFFGPTTFIEAVEHSRNISTLRLFESLGVQRGVEMVKRFDFVEGGQHWDMRPELAMCLGSMDASPLSMAAAYQVIANQGVGIRPHFFRNIYDKEGRIAIPRRWQEQAIIDDPIVAYQMQYILRQTVVTGTGRSPIGSKFPSPPSPPVAGKTGTTNDCRDAWFCGFTPDLVIVTQVGFDTPHPMGPQMTGGRVAGSIWAEAFAAILPTRQNWKLRFEEPPGVEYADISSDTGKRASEITSQYGHMVYRNVPFHRGKAPRQQDDGVTMAPIIAPVGDAYYWLVSRSPRTGFATVPEDESSIIEENDNMGQWF